MRTGPEAGWRRNQRSRLTWSVGGRPGRGQDGGILSECKVSAGLRSYRGRGRSAAGRPLLPPRSDPSLLSMSVSKWRSDSNKDLLPAGPPQQAGGGLRRAGPPQQPSGGLQRRLLPAGPPQQPGGGLLPPLVLQTREKLVQSDSDHLLYKELSLKN